MLGQCLNIRFLVLQEIASIFCETNPPGDAHAAQRRAAA